MFLFSYESCSCEFCYSKLSLIIHLEVILASPHNFLIWGLKDFDFAKHIHFGCSSGSYLSFKFKILVLPPSLLHLKSEGKDMKLRVSRSHMRESESMAGVA